MTENIMKKKTIMNRVELYFIQKRDLAVLFDCSCITHTYYLLRLLFHRQNGFLIAIMVFFPFFHILALQYYAYCNFTQSRTGSGSQDSRPFTFPFWTLVCYAWLIIGLLESGRSRSNFQHVICRFSSWTTKSRSRPN